MGAKQSRPIMAGLAAACVAQLPAETRAFANPMAAMPPVAKQSRQFLYLGNDGETVPIASGVKKNKLQQPDLIIPPSSLGIDEAWAATVELEMEMNKSRVEEDFDDDHDDAPELNVQDKAESLHRSLLEARLRLEKRAAIDSRTFKPLVNDDNDIRLNKFLDSVRVQVEATAQKLDAALASFDDTDVGTTFELQPKETRIAEKETEMTFKKKELGQLSFKKSTQPADTRIYRAFLSLKEKRLEEALRAAEDYELMAAEALRKAQEEEKIRLACLAVIQKLTVDAVRKAEEERQLLAAKKSEILHRSLLETRLEMESSQKPFCTTADTVAITDLDLRPKRMNNVAVETSACIPRQRKAMATFLSHRALLEKRLKMESKAKEISLKAGLLSQRSKEDETMPHFATEVTTSKREIPNDIHHGSDMIKGHDSQSRSQYYFVDEIPSAAKKGVDDSGDAVEACTQEHDLKGAIKSFSLPSFFGEALDTVANALDSVDKSFAKWIESRSNSKETSSTTNSVEESHQLRMSRIDRVEEVRTGSSPAAAPRPTFIIRSARSITRLPPFPNKDFTSEPFVHANGKNVSNSAAASKRPNDTEKSTHRSSEQEERQSSRDKANGRPTFILRKGKGEPGPEKDEGEPQIQSKNSSQAATLSYRQDVSHANTTSSLMNDLMAEMSITEISQLENSVILGNSISHLAKFASGGGKAVIFALGVVLEAATSEGFVTSTKVASSRVASVLESVKKFMNSTSIAEGFGDTTIEDDELAADDVTTQISAAASSFADVGKAFIRSINSSPLSSEVLSAVMESTNECVSLLASLSAFAIKQSERALHSEPFILEQQIVLEDISLRSNISKCRVGISAGKNAKPTIDSTENQNESTAKKPVEVVSFQNTQDRVFLSKADRDAIETRELFRSIFHS